ncbi:MAG: hypothetical protein WB812_12290, partial [Woeseiaceae bacterium]
YETFGNSTAETVTRHADEDSLTREWYRPWPPDPVFRWSMRDDVNYQETGALAILDWSARHAKEMLRDFYRTGYDSWRKGIDQKPYAYVIPADQPDRRRVAQMINRLRDQHIEVGRLASPLSLAEGDFARGDYIVKLDQPYRNFAVDVLEPQKFPAESENLPYDDMSWAYPVGFGVKTVPIGDERVKSISPDPLMTDATASGSVHGKGPVYLLREQGQESLLAARYRLGDADVRISERAFTLDRMTYPPGSWIISAGKDQSADNLADEVAGLADELALDFTSARKAPDVASHAAPVPRVGLWVPWADTDMMGWIRFIFDRDSIPYTYIRDEDLRAGGLKNKVDVIVYGPFSRLQLAGQIHGIAATDGPIPFRSSPEFPSLGKPVASDDITGGPGYAGLAELQRFVESGGVLLTLGTGTTLALEGGLVRGVPRTSDSPVFTPGIQLRSTFEQPDHPLAYGYGPETTVFRTNLPVYDTPRRWLTMAYCTSCLTGPVDERHVVMVWGGEGKMVVSGGMRGEADLKGHPAVLDTPTGAGHIVTYNFSGIHRDMNPAQRRLVWNAILNWNALPTDSP